MEGDPAATTIVGAGGFSLLRRIGLLPAVRAGGLVDRGTVGALALAPSWSGCGDLRFSNVRLCEWVADGGRGFTTR